MRYLMLTAALLLAACSDGPPPRDYASSAACADRGLKMGMPGYDECMREEAQHRAMEEQRRDYEEQKRMDEFWRQQRR